jgi:hypothetical protein
MPENMTNEVLIGIGGLILSVLTYFAGVWRTERRHMTEDRETRIRRVFERYMEFRRTNNTGGYDGLQKSGISTLASNEEITELTCLIVAHGEAHPLGSDHEVVFKNVDLLQFFKFAAAKRVNFVTTPIERVIKESGSRP